MSMAGVWVDGDTRAPLPPKLRGLPLLGNLLPMLRDPLTPVLDGYRKYGQIFRISALNQRWTVLAGVAANNCFGELEVEHLIAKPAYQGFIDGLQTDQFILAMDGPAHTHLRRVLKRGYSRQAIAHKIPDLVELTREQARGWRIGEPFDFLRHMKRLVTRQLGVALARRDAGHIFEDLLTFMATIINVTQLKKWPRLAMKIPPYTTARARLHQLTREVVADHRSNPSPEGERDLIDDVLAATDLHGNPFGDDVFLAQTIGPFLAGLDTVANSVAFAIYGIIKHPKVLASARAEVDELFGSGTPTMDGIRGLDIVRRAVMESMRMYPVAVLLLREAARPFEFAGHRIDAGDQVFLANALPHFLEEYYPDPFTYDIDRYTRERAEHKVKGAYTPFGIGRHTCLGAGLGELQIVTIVATLLREVELRLHPRDYEVKVRVGPLRMPDKKFRLAVERWR